MHGSGCLLTPGLVNTHQHLYQWATRGHAVDSTLFEWLTALYPVWAGLDEEVVRAAATGGARLAGADRLHDEHRPPLRLPARRRRPAGRRGAAAAAVGLRFHPTRGSMDLGASQGGLPPDSVVEDLDAILAATEDAIDRFHDPAPDAMVRVARRAVLAVLGDRRS